jgi:hypothetical protein
LAEIIIVQPQDADVSAKPQFIGAPGPRQIVVDEEPRSAPPLHPRVVEAADSRERAAFEHHGPGGERLGEVGGGEQAFVPGKRGIEIIHQTGREHVRVAGGEGIERLGRSGVKQGIDRVGVCRLLAGIGLKAKPGRIPLVYVVVDPRGLHLLAIVARMRIALPVGASIAVGRIAGGGVTIAVKRAAEHG